MTILRQWICPECDTEVYAAHGTDEVYCGCDEQLIKMEPQMGLDGRVSI